MAKQTMDIMAKFPGLTIIHQKIPSHEVGRHEHLEHEFFLPLQGDISVLAASGAVKAGPGHMLYVPPQMDHSFSSTAQGSGERVIWLIEAKLWDKHGQESFAPSVLPSNSLVKELIFYLLIHRQTEGARYFISALIESLIESLKGAQIGRLQLQHLEAKIKDARVKKSIEFMESHLDCTSIASVAERSGLSLRNLNRLFMEEVGLSPKDYLIHCRIAKAKSLLRESRSTITDIALEVGYNSLSKFIETFKNLEGVLPSDYRIAHRQ